MSLYQYIGREYTRISLIEGEEKVKVVEGEIVESDRDEKVFTRNGFQKLEEGMLEEIEEIKEEKPKKGKQAKTPVVEETKEEEKEPEEVKEEIEETPVVETEQDNKNDDPFA